MRDCQTIDIEDVLQAALNAEGTKAAAPPIPTDLGPCVAISRTGGYGQEYVQDVSTVDFDCYERTEAEAMAKACRLTRWARALPEADTGASIYASQITVEPYNNPDPNHPTLPRATFTVQITSRVQH